MPSKDERGDIQCELFEYSILESDTANHPYEALSYVWGGEDKPQSILIDNKALKVTQNLYTALLHFRNRQCPRLLWVDAICIDQETDEEKEHQIQLMAAIYAGASRVLVWLGEAQDKSDQALKSICDAGEKSAKASDLDQQSIQKLL